MVAPVELHEQAFLRHARPAAAMLRRAMPSRTAQPGRVEEARDRLSREPQAFALRQQFG